MTGWQGEHPCWQLLWVPAEAKSSEASFDLCSPLRSKPETWAEWNTWETWRQRGGSRWLRWLERPTGRNQRNTGGTRPLYMIACNSVGYIDAIDISIELGEIWQVHGKSQMFPGVPSFGSLGSARQGSELNMTQAIHYCLRASPAMAVEFTGKPPKYGKHMDIGVPSARAPFKIPWKSWQICYIIILLLEGWIKRSRVLSWWRNCNIVCSCSWLAGDWGTWPGKIWNSRLRFVGQFLDMSDMSVDGPTSPAARPGRGKADLNGAEPSRCEGWHA